MWYENIQYTKYTIIWCLCHVCCEKGTIYKHNCSSSLVMVSHVESLVFMLLHISYKALHVLCYTFKMFECIAIFHTVPCRSDATAYSTQYYAVLFWQIKHTDLCNMICLLILCAYYICILLIRLFNLACISNWIEYRKNVHNFNVFSICPSSANTYCPWCKNTCSSPGDH